MEPQTSGPSVRNNAIFKTMWWRKRKISLPKKAHDKSTNTLRGSFPLSFELREEGFLADADIILC